MYYIIICIANSRMYIIGILYTDTYTLYYYTVMSRTRVFFLVTIKYTHHDYFDLNNKLSMYR